MQFAYMEGGGFPVVKPLPSAASKTWTQGHLANFESGALDNYTTGDAAIIGVVNDSVASSTAAGYDVNIVIPTERTVFEAKYGSTAGTFSSTDIGSRFKPYPGALEKVSTTGYTTAGALLLVGYDNDQAKGFFKIAADKVHALAGR